MMRAFTLIELVLVLVILTVLATIAIEMVEPQVDQAKFEATQKTVAGVRDAILAQRDGGNGHAVVTGFYCDMGRLPQAYPESATVLSLRELWDASALTTNLALYRNVPADVGNVSNSTDSDGDSVVPDSGVSLGLGWRGPYLKMAVGADRIYDGWGVALESDAAYPRLATIDVAAIDGDSNANEDVPVTTAGTPVYGVRSLGRGDSPDSGSETAYQIDLPAIEDGKNNLGLNDRQLVGTVNGTVFVEKGLSASADDIVVQLYFPDSSGNGQIEIEVAEVTVNALDHPTHDRFDFQFDGGPGALGSGGQRLFPVGARIIKAYLNSPGDLSGDFADGVSDPVHQSFAVPVQIFPENAPVSITIN